MNNTVNVAGAAIYANDMSRCRWLGGLTGSRTIFEITLEEGSPFRFSNNTVDLPGGASQGEVINQVLATNAAAILARSNVMYCMRLL